MIKLRKDQIEENLSVCAYCYEPQGNRHMCCGENHFEEGYLTVYGEIYLDSDVIIIEPTIAEIEEHLIHKRADDAYDKWKDEQ